MVSMQSAGASAPFTGSSATPTPKATSADLKIGFLESVDSLNPFQGLNDPSYLLYGLVYDYLFSFDEDGNYVPNLALSASCDAVCMNWTYQIRQGVTWHDGTPFTVDDVVFSINYNSQSIFHLWAFEPYMNRIVQPSGKGFRRSKRNIHIRTRTRSGRARSSPTPRSTPNTRTSPRKPFICSRIRTTTRWGPIPVHPRSTTSICSSSRMSRRWPSLSSEGTSTWPR